MRISRRLLLVAGLFLLTGCVPRVKPDCDPCVRNSSACRPTGTCSAQTVYDVSWDRTCADYPVSYRSVVAEVTSEPGAGLRLMRAGDLVEAGRVQ